jgi:hypothetical protein
MCKCFVLTALLILLASSIMFAQTDGSITLQQGINSYSGCYDTYLDDGDANYYENYGIDNDPDDWTKYRDIKVRYSTTSYDQWVTLIKFDLSTLPTNWSITSASLSLYYYDESVMGVNDWVTVAAYALKRSWDEGSGPHTGDDRTGASWYYQYAKPSTAQWYYGGARGANHDRDASYDSQVTLYHDTYGWATWGGTEITNTVREWYNGSRANNGWQLDAIACSDSCNGVLFHNSEYSIVPADYMWRPKLVINYTVIPEPMSLLTLAAGIAVLATKRRKI